MTSFNGPIGNTLRYLTTNDTPPYTLISNNPTVNTVTNFTINTNYCLALNIKESDKNSVLEIYPNPANNSLNINSNYGIIKSTVYDVTVGIVLSSDDQTSIDVSKLNSGLYFIKIKTEQGEFSRKFIKE
jgi:aspartate carbamoyltransferase regulatory subunit